MLDLGTSRVLKLFHDGWPGPVVVREAAATRLVHEAGGPAPRCFGTLEIGGRHGVVLERIHARSMLAEALASPWLIGRFAGQLADLHASIHALHGRALPSQRAEITRSVEAAPALDARDQEAILAAVAGLGEGDRVCHGDLHPDNVLMAGRGPVAIDWLTATSGDPAADVARTLVLIEVAAAPPGTGTIALVLIRGARRIFRTAYLRRYLAQRPELSDRVDAWLPVVAAARLADGIDAERAGLLRIVRRVHHPPKDGAHG